ncbi:MAG: ATP-binding cassette domain-containing protein [Alphaproteobacteria bacterium]|nr:ATP-binding cassette domain-containing protein [Alphaproteobacteria bacterium]
MLNVNNLTVQLGGREIISSISLSVAPGKTLAVLGESGAGKSTLVGAILGLLRASSGQISWAGKPIERGKAALVMQEPRSAFNPRLPLRRSVLEPLYAGKLPDDPARLERLCKGLEIDPNMLDRLPYQVSIGQAQRAGVLRALIASPPLILFDEPLSALDAVTQKHTAKLISTLQQEEGFAALIVTHDMGYAAAHADSIAVLRSGHIEEMATAENFFRSPQSQYGQDLLNAAVSLGAIERAVI